MLIATLLLLASEPASPEPWEMSSCFENSGSADRPALRYVGNRVCVPLEAPRPMSGVWLNIFEGSEFIEGGTTVPKHSPGPVKIWLSIDDQTTWPERTVGPLKERAYRVRFIGRPAKDMNRPRGDGYGHFFMSPGLVLVDQILELTDLGPAVGEAR